jgi:hypothetical protein
VIYAGKFLAFSSGGVFWLGISGAGSLETHQGFIGVLRELIHEADCGGRIALSQEDVLRTHLACRMVLLESRCRAKSSLPVPSTSVHKL